MPFPVLPRRNTAWVKRAFAGVIRPAEQNAKASMPQANLRRPYFPPQQAAKAPCPLFAGSRCKTGRACFTASIAHLPAAVHAEPERRRKKITCAEKCKGPAPALTLPRRPWYGNDRVFLNDTDVPYGRPSNCGSHPSPGSAAFRPAQLTGGVWSGKEPISMNRPNVLFLFSDQQRWDTVSCYGQPLGAHFA